MQNQSGDEDGNLPQYSGEEIFNVYASLRESFREEDVIAEYNRDTIGLIIPDLVGEDTSTRIKAIFLQQNSSSKNSDNDLDHPGFAVGIVTVEDHNKDKDELLRLLDQALFLASEEESDGIYLRTDKDNNQTI
jgi:GGDEF domain-containing protein